jgi:hypothetical protein
MLLVNIIGQSRFELSWQQIFKGVINRKGALKGLLIVKGL